MYMHVLFELFASIHNVLKFAYGKQESIAGIWTLLNNK